MIFELDCVLGNFCSSGTKAIPLSLLCIPKICLLFQNSWSSHNTTTSTMLGNILKNGETFQMKYMKCHLSVIYSYISSEQLVMQVSRLLKHKTCNVGIVHKTALGCKSRLNNFTLLSPWVARVWNANAIISKVSVVKVSVWCYKLNEASADIKVQIKQFSI